MVAFILPANSATGGFDIDNSLRFNDDDNPSLSRDNDSGGSNTAGTLSFWTKRSEIDTGYLFFARSDDSNVFNVYFSGSERLEIRSSQGGSVDFQYKTNALFRDPSAWYHIVIAIDTTDGTAADRCKLFVNGSRITSFNTQTNFGDSDTIELFQSDATVYVSGEHEGGTIGSPYDGYIADLNFVDGTQYDASNFGETNDNGVWIPKKFGGTQGTNGFRLEFKQTGTSANASGMGADTSGNTNHLTPSNLTATDVTTDTPTNNFATYNSLRPNNQATLSEGNCFVTGVTGGSTSMEYHQLSTILVNKGKWYWEMKITANNTISANTYIGCGYWDDSDSTHGTTVQGCLVVSGTSNVRGGGSYGNTATFQSSLTAPVQNDIYGFAVNCDDEEITFFRNGSAHGSADNDYSALSPEQKLLGPYAGHGGSSQLQNIHLNTGNPAFAISSGNADANGYGNFEFAPPSGYYALCTKNLAEYG